LAKPMIVVESPAKARTISKYLGGRYSVKASMGHVRDLPKSKLGIDVEHGFEPQYITIRGKGEMLKELRAAAGKASRVYIATDPDREGEAIAWHLMHALNLDLASPCRVEFNEITKDVVARALKNPRRIDWNLVNAQQARRVLDRLVGYELSPLLWRKVKRGLSAGRVQSVALRLVCDREDEINRFIPKEYWSVTALLDKKDGGEAKFVARFVGRRGDKADLSNEQEAEAVVAGARAHPFVVCSVNKKERKKHAYPPFTTSTMQQDAARKLGFGVKRTMATAQQLYEGLDIGPEGVVGLITYIRTDSTRTSEGARAEAREYIKNQFGAEYIGPGVMGPKSRRAQEAHEAIRPTSVLRTPEQVARYLKPDQAKLYALIWARFVASQMQAAVYDTVTADISAGEFLFRASGSVLRFPGYTALYQEGREEDNDKEEDMQLPELCEGEELRLLRLTKKQHFTQPPPRYTEATLVRALEEKGIGRPSTYAPIIDTLLSRGYVVRKDRRLHPTELGCLVVDLLREHFPDVIDVEFTASLEDKLDMVEDGEAGWQEVVSEFYGPFKSSVERADRLIEKVELPDELADEYCDKCGTQMVVKTSRFGKFLACPRFPECRFTKPMVVKTGVACPVCGKEIVERRTRTRRKMWGCSGYPECIFVSWHEPTNKACPECGAFMTVRRSKRKGVRYVCSSDTCKREVVIEGE